MIELEEDRVVGDVAAAEVEPVGDLAQRLAARSEVDRLVGDVARKAGGIVVGGVEQDREPRSETIREVKAADRKPVSAEVVGPVQPMDLQRKLESLEAFPFDAAVELAILERVVAREATEASAFDESEG